MNGLKLCVVTNLFHPDVAGGAGIITDFCQGLQDAGHDVTVITTFPYYPEWKNKAGASLLSRQRTDHAGVSVERFGLYIPRNPRRFAERLLYEASVFFSMSRKLTAVKRDSYDAVVAYCPMIGAVVCARLIAARSRAPLWVNVQDLPADAASHVTQGAKQSAGILDWIQNKALGLADVITTISPVIEERLRSIFPGHDVRAFPNWMHQTLADAITTGLQSVEPAPPEGDASATAPVRLLYAGNIGEKQDLVSLVDYLHSTTLPFELSIFGAGSTYERVRQRITSIGDDRIHIAPLLSETEFAQALIRADLFLICEKSDVGASFIPSKLIPAITAGTPPLCVCAAQSPLGVEVQRFDLGPRYDWSQLDDLKDAITSAGSRDAVFTAWQDACKARSKDYTRQAAIHNGEQLLNELTTRNAKARSGR